MVLGIVTHNNTATAGLGWAGVATNTKSAGGNLNFRPGPALVTGHYVEDRRRHIGAHRANTGSAGLQLFALHYRN